MGKKRSTTKTAKTTAKKVRSNKRTATAKKRTAGKTVRPKRVTVTPSDPGKTPHGAVALAFASALAAGDFTRARELLAPEQRKAITSVELRGTYEAMISYGGTPADEVEVMNVMETWPAKEPGDIGWAYVAISGDGYGEGIAVVVAAVGSDLLVRDIEWGRP